MATALLGAWIGITASMFALVLVLTLYVTPELVSLGRALDFVPRDPPPPEMGRFRILHGASTGLDGANPSADGLAGIVLLARWAPAC